MFKIKALHWIPPSPMYTNNTRGDKQSWASQSYSFQILTEPDILQDNFQTTNQEWTRGKCFVQTPQIPILSSYILTRPRCNPLSSPGLLWEQVKRLWRQLQRKGEEEEGWHRRWRWGDLLWEPPSMADHLSFRSPDTWHFFVHGVHPSTLCKGTGYVSLTST